MKGMQYAPRIIVTDKLESYVAAHREVRNVIFERSWILISSSGFG